MLSLETVLTIVSLPLGILISLTYDKIKTFSRHIDSQHFQKLFFKYFYKVLRKKNRASGGLLKAFKKSVKANSQRFLEIFAENIEDFHAFLLPGGQDEFHSRLAEDLVSEFSLTEQHRVLTVILVAECLEGYRKSFIGTLNQKQFMELLLLFQDVNSRIIRRELKDQGRHIIAEMKRLLKKEEKAAKKEIGTAAAIEGKQIKVLAMTASPKGSDSLLYEMEQDTLLEVFGRFERRRVFLDMPDPVKSTLEEIREHLLEGNLREVRGRELADLLISLKKEQEIDVKLVILSACHSARRELH
jgi:hypothetical protein